ncbi:MAG TPA: hypothetical protein VN687_07965 [Blastocatellia bacterium]|nr:hypothetical protein [Blastocatellia bacterium]
MDIEIKVWNWFALFTLGPAIVLLVWLLSRTWRRGERVPPVIVSLALLMGAAICWLAGKNVGTESTSREVVFGLLQITLTAISVWMLRRAKKKQRTASSHSAAELEWKPKT